MKREFYYILAGIGILYLASVIPKTVDASPSEPGSTPTHLTAARVVQLPDTYPRSKVPVISGLAVSPAENLLSAAGDDHLIRLWNLSDGTLLRPLFGHEDWVRTVLFVKSTNRLVSAGDDGNLFYWDGYGEQATDKPALSPLRNGRPIYCAAVSPDDTLLVLGGWSDKLLVVDSKSGKKLRELDAPGADIRAVAFSPDGDSLAAAGREGRIRIWTMPSGERRHDLVGHGVRVWALAYAPDGKWLASAGEEHFVRLWDAKTGNPGPVLERRPGTGSALAFCGPSWLAVGGSDNSIRLWNLDALSQPFELEGHTGTVTQLVWDSASSTLYSAGYDTTIRVWSLERPLAAGAAVSRKPEKTATR